MTNITNDDIKVITMLTKMADVLTKLQDKKVLKVFEDGAAAKLKEVDALRVENNVILKDARTFHKDAELNAARAAADKEAVAEDLIKVTASLKELKDMSAEFSNFSKGKEEELLLREKLAEASIRDADRAIDKARKAEEKFDALSVDLEDKLAKLKAATA